VLKRIEGEAKITAAPSGGLYSLGGVLLAAGLYSALHIGARLAASGNLGEDDPLEAILTQTLALGYIPGHLPLYDWALWLLAQVFGPGALRFQLLKYGLLTAACGFIFLAARRVMKGDALWAFLSVEALALIYQISWRFHEGFTHQVGALCAVAASFWAFIRVVEDRRAGNYALFGVAVGLGALTVATYWIFLAALLIAAALQPAIRPALRRREILLTAAIAGLIAAPHYLWLAATPEGLSAILPHPQGETGLQAGMILAGIRRAFTEPVMYLAPLIFLYPIFFPAMLRDIWVTAGSRSWRSAEPDFETLILHMALICIAFLIAGAALFGVYRYATHALMPLFLVTSIWLTAMARRAARSEAQIRRFVIMAAGVAVFAFCGRAANMYVLEPVCGICRWGVPYADLAAEMKAAGADEGGILVADWELGGNLHPFFAANPMALADKQVYAPPGFDPAGPITAVWAAEEKPGWLLGRLRAFRPELTSEDLAAAKPVEIPWRSHLWKPDGYRISAWRVLKLPPALPPGR
jgi:hypothetical protein